MTSSREWDSAAYHRLSDYQYAWGRKVLARAPKRDHQTVMDAGCGTGRLTAELLRSLPHGRVAAVDLSGNMLRSARTNLQAEFSGRAWFVNADVQALPFAAAFDGIFSTATLHWAKDHPRLFRSLFAALKPRGWLEAQCGGGANLARMRHRANTLIASAKYAPFFQGWSEPWEYASPEVTAERLWSAGFVQINTWLEPAEFALPDKGVFKQYLATVTLHRHIERIPDPKLRDDFLEDMVGLASADPEFSLDYWRLNIQAAKPE